MGNCPIKSATTMKGTIMTMTIEQFNQRCDIVETQGKLEEVNLHELAMFALEQINTPNFNNTTPCNRLISSLSLTKRKEALIVWFLDFGKVKRNTKDHTLDYSDKKELKIYGETIDSMAILDYADEKPFYVYSKEITPASVYDVQKAIASIIKRAASANKNGLTIEHGELVSKLNELLPIAA